MRLFRKKRPAQVDVFAHVSLAGHAMVVESISYDIHGAYVTLISEAEFNRKHRA